MTDEGFCETCGHEKCQRCDVCPMCGNGVEHVEAGQEQILQHMKRLDQAQIIQKGLEDSIRDIMHVFANEHEDIDDSPKTYWSIKAIMHKYKIKPLFHEYLSEED